MCKKIMKMKQRKLRLIPIISFMIIIMVGCSTKDKLPETTIYDDITRVSREVNIENKDELVLNLINSIEGKQDSIININPDDVIQDININNSYFFNNAIYLQIDTYMYRFQLQDNNVISYIKYNLEA